MNKNDLELLIAKDLSTRQIAEQLSISQTTVRYWLNRHSLKTKPSKPFKCSKCDETDPTKFYGHKKSVCGSCHNKDVIDRGRRLKEWAVAKMGGKCSECGYNKSLWALQFHHLNPSIKDSNFNSMRGWSKKRLASELQGCVLLCANCHLEEHERLSLL